MNIASFWKLYLTTLFFFFIYRNPVPKLQRNWIAWYVFEKYFRKSVADISLIFIHITEFVFFFFH
jgi:hypothetical protein